MPAYHTQLRAYRSPTFQPLRESLRHEFRGKEVRIELTWSSGSRLVAVWPEHQFSGVDDVAGWFYLQLSNRREPASLAETRAALPRLGIVPVLAPVEHTEQLLDV